MQYSNDDTSFDDGYRSDGRNLAQTWMDGHDDDGKASLVHNLEELSSVDTDKTEYLLGLFGPSHMNFHDQRDEEKEPSLSEMAKKALEVRTTYHG